MAEAIALGQQIIERCPDAFVDVLGPDSRQTTSVGIAVYPDHGRNPEMVIRAADDSLYRAKRAGRNQVSTADDLSHLASAT
jgi:diguanylate cyclase (GGDEF)-like protein